MKKILFCIIGLSLAMMPLVSCGDSSPKTSTQIPKAINNASSASESSESTNVPAESALPTPASAESEGLSVNAALAVYSTWLNNCDDMSSFTLNKQYYQLFDIFGEQYYWFSANDPSKYWYHILVHMQTGELLFMMKSDGEHSATSIELLDDWYNESAETEDVPSTLTPLSVNDAIAVYSTWLDSHEEVSSYTLDNQYYQTFDLFGAQYYWFNANDPSRYWYNILVHMQTGELLFMMTSDGEYPTTSIEPLDNWYGNNYAFG